MFSHSEKENKMQTAKSTEQLNRTTSRKALKTFDWVDCISLGADINEVVRHYIFQGQHDKVKLCWKKYNADIFQIIKYYRDLGQEDKACEYQLLNNKDYLSLIKYYYQQKDLSEMREYIALYLIPKQPISSSFFMSFLFPLRQDPLIHSFIHLFNFIDETDEFQERVDIWEIQEKIQDWDAVPVSIRDILTECGILFDKYKELRLRANSN